MNQTFTVTSGDVEVASTTGTRDYTVTGLNVGTQVRIQLVGTGAFNSDGSFVLTSTGEAGNRLSSLSTTGIGAAVITHVNGADVVNAATQLLTPATTTATFRVSLGANNDAAIPVVFETATAGGTTLAANLAGAPKKAYGVGGRVTFRNAAATAPAKATTGTITAGAVTVVWPTGVEIAGNTGLHVFRDHDVYQLGGAAITKAQFMSIVGVGDTLAATAYRNNSTSANPSTFNITTDVLNVATFTSVVASSTNLGQVTVRWTPGTQASVNGTTFNLQRRQVPTVGQAHNVAGVAGVAGEWSTVWTGTLPTLSEQTFIETLAAGNFQYRVQSVAPAFAGTATVTTQTVTEGTATIAVSTTVTGSAPSIRRVYLTQNASNINNLSAGDQFKVVFNQTVNQPAVGSTLVLWVAGDNTGALTLTNRAAGTTSAGSATFTVNTASEVVDGVSHAAGRVLTVTLNANPDPGVAAFWTGDEGLRIVSGTGIGNNAGNMPTQTANNAITRDVVS